MFALFLQDKAAKKKAIETSARKKAAAAAVAAAFPDADESPSKRSLKRKQSVEPSDSEVSDYLDPEHPQTLRSRKERKKNKEPSNPAPDDSGSEVFEDFESAEPRSRDAAWKEDEEGILPIAKLKAAKRVEASSRATGTTNGADSSTSRLPAGIAGPSRSRNEGKKPESKASRPDQNSVFALPPGFVHPFGPRKEKKRTPEAARLDQDETKATSSRTTKRARTSSPLQDGHTVIIGAGIVGLFTAYELASRCLEGGIKHKITVVEIRDGICELASGHCAGFLSARDIPRDKEWYALLFDAQETWKKMRSKVPAFFSDEPFFAKEVGDADDEGYQMPSWFKPRPIHRVDDDASCIGRVDTKRLAVWLHRQCLTMNVNFVFGKAPEAVEQSSNGISFQMSVGDPDRPFKDSLQIDCTNIVVAAGPFTTWIAQYIFNGAEKTGLVNKHQSYLRLDVPLKYQSDPTDEAAIAVATTDDWSAGNMSMIFDPNEASIRISAAEKPMANVNIPHFNARDSPWYDTTSLKALAAGYLDVKHGKELEVSNSGGATVSLARGRQPYVGPLRMRSDKSSDIAEIPNVWLSYGFGQFGTTLAPGAALAMVRMMLGEQ